MGRNQQTAIGKRLDIMKVHLGRGIDFEQARRRAACCRDFVKVLAPRGEHDRSVVQPCGRHELAGRRNRTDHERRTAGRGHAPQQSLGRVGDPLAVRRPEHDLIRRLRRLTEVLRLETAERLQIEMSAAQVREGGSIRRQSERSWQSGADLEQPRGDGRHPRETGRDGGDRKQDSRGDRDRDCKPPPGSSAGRCRRARRCHRVRRGQENSRLPDVPQTDPGIGLETAFDELPN